MMQIALADIFKNLTFFIGYITKILKSIKIKNKYYNSFPILPTVFPVKLPDEFIFLIMSTWFIT